MSDKRLPPLCRYCGKEIGKKTQTILFGTENQALVSTDHYVTKAERPKTRQEAQALTNRAIVSVRYTGEGEGRYIGQASTWDGISYKDNFFCTGEHAQSFAYAVVQMKDQVITTDSYRTALAAQKSQSGE